MNLNKNHAQTASEFLIMVGFLMFFFVTFFLIINEMTSSKASQRIDKSLELLAYGAQDEVSLAVKASEGYVRQFTIPNTIEGNEYNITINQGRIFAYTLNREHAISLLASNVSGDFIKGRNTIKKINSTVRLN
jgi:hypothetical protein